VVNEKTVQLITIFKQQHGGKWEDLKIVIKQHHGGKQKSVQLITIFKQHHGGKREDCSIKDGYKLNSLLVYHRAAV
jgi:hypothetical protein